MHFNVRGGAGGRLRRLGRGNAHGSGPALTAQSYNDLAKQSINVAPFTYRAVDPDLFEKIVTQALPPGPGPDRRKPIRARPRGRSTSMLGKLTWAAIPLDQPIPLAAAGSSSG